MGVNVLGSGVAVSKLQADRGLVLIIDELGRLFIVRFIDGSSAVEGQKNWSDGLATQA